MAFVTFTSPSRNLHVDFPPNTFGLGKGVEGEDAPYPLVTFKEGILNLDEEDRLQKKQIDMLRKHPQFKDVFHEAGNSLNALNTISVHLPGDGVSEETKVLLAKLHKAAHGKSIPPNYIDEVISNANKVYDIFQTVGLARIPQGSPAVIVKSSLILFLDAMDRGEIWNDG